MEEHKQIKNETFLTFRLGNERFASAVTKVLNILEVQPITKIPQAPAYIKGVINLRGMVLPVIDTRVKFGMEPIQINPNTGILVLDVMVDDIAVKLGAMVDSVDEVIELSPDQIQEPPTIGAKYRSEFIEGLAQADDKFIMILNMDRVFSADEILVVENATH
jgi:purine-binding chemotaxis protein CheW